MPPSRTLLVRLPCRKVFPTGPIYLMSLLKRAAPGMELRLLDLALVEGREREAAVLGAIREFGPELVAFSWRDMQVFSPQDMDGGLRDAFAFLHDPSLARKIGAAFRGLRDMAVYRGSIGDNLGIVRRIAAAFPGAEIALGGPSVKVFGDWMRGRLPPRVRLYPDVGLGRFFESLGLSPLADEVEPMLDLPAIEAAFPQWPAYRDEIIGLQTKRGCPRNCLYCLYGKIEGKAIVRRDAGRVVDEISSYARRWGTGRFWLADAQLLCDRADRDHLAAILEGVLRAGLRLEWSGYLRLDGLDPELASLMVRSGLRDLEISLGSGAQSVVDELELGFEVEELLAGCATLAGAGYRGRVLVNLSLNAPGETEATLRETFGALRRIEGVFGPGRVKPVVFFLAIQPGTGLERRAIAEGRLAEGYDPLSAWPWRVERLIYNPPPLGRLVGRACALAFRGVGPRRRPEGGPDAEADAGPDTGAMILESIEAALAARERGKHGRS